MTVEGTRSDFPALEIYSYDDAGNVHQIVNDPASPFGPFGLPLTEDIQDVTSADSSSAEENSDGAAGYYGGAPGGHPN